MKLLSSKNKNIIFIIGESRSGKTLLGNFISIHKNTYWFSNYTNKFPNLPMLSLFNRTRDVPVIGDIVKRRLTKTRGSKLIPKPSEGDKIYENCGLVHYRWSTENDLTDYQKSSLRNIIKSHQRFTGKSHFINDQSANIQRIRQIVKIFPQAKFIHVIRDGRAVANEMAKTDWWNDSYIPWFGQLKDNLDNSVNEPVALCGLHWKRNIETILNESNIFKDNYLEIKYEDLVENTIDIIIESLNFCGLEWYEEYSEYIPGEIPNNNYQYCQDLTQEQIDELNYLLADLLKYLRYDEYPTLRS